MTDPQRYFFSEEHAGRDNPVLARPRIEFKTAAFIPTHPAYGGTGHSAVFW